MTRADIFDATDEAATELVEAVADSTDTDSNQEATMSDDTTKTQDEKDAQHEPTVEAFQGVVEQAVAEADQDTGTVSEVNLDAAAKAYREITGGIKYKNQAKNYVDAAMKAALPAGEYIKAVSYNEIAEKIRTTKPEPRSTRPTVDPKVVFAELIAAHQVALEYLESNVPDEAEDYEPLATESIYGQAAEWLEWSKADEDERGDEPELTGPAAAAVKLIQGKAAGRRGGRRAGTYSGVRRNVAKHIESAFANKAPGEFLTVSEITNHRSEEYGDDAPSSGAVSARLFPGGDASKCNVEGITPGVNEDTVKGAFKN